MILLAAVDDRGGMLFNHRRQSQDKVLRERVLIMTADGVLWMNAYTAKLFGDAPQIHVDDAFLEKARAGEYCFLEDTPAASREEDVEQVVLFKWNREYPGDLFFDLDLTGWKLSDTEDFPGSSHEKITREVYDRA